MAVPEETEEEKAPPALPDKDAEQPNPAVQVEPLSWMKDTLEWGARALPGENGMTMRRINVGFYGEVPEESRDMSRRPRGAFSIPGVPATDLYVINRKEELWADNAVDLYEEAIQRRWAAHIDIPWDELGDALGGDLEPNPDAVRREAGEETQLAMRQFCTELAQQASTETDVIGQWLHRMNYAYHEVKTYLATQLFDSGRHYEAFRRRALANGGALGLESPGHINRRLLESRAGWTETALYLYIIRGTLTLLLYRYGEAYARNWADKAIFRFCMQDKARHMAYGMAHLKYAIEHRGPDYALGLRRLLGGVERDLAFEMEDPVLWEALAIIIGDGIENIVTGMDVVKGLQQKYIEQYMARMQWIGVEKNKDNLNPDLAAYLRLPETTQAAT